MPIPTTMTAGQYPSHEQAMIELGFRAFWLHNHLTQAASVALTPREQTALTLVATVPNGAILPTLTEQLRARGVDREQAQRCIRRLLTEGWLSSREAGETTVIDLPADDLVWIAFRAGRLGHLS